MNDVTRLLDDAAAGGRKSAGDLLLLVYDELRKLAAARMASEKPGHSLDPTALMHEAYLRLIGDQRYDSRGHFFAAAEAMRRVLVNPPGTAADRSEAVDLSGSTSTNSPVRPPRPMTTSSNSTPPSTGWRSSFPPPPSWSSSGSSRG